MLKPLTLSKNAENILENIILNNKISQNEVAFQTNINKSVVSKEVSQLEKLNLIKIKAEKNKKILQFNDSFANNIIIEIDRYFIHAFLNTSLGYNIEKIFNKVDLIDVNTLFIEIEKIIDYFLSITKVDVIGIGIAVHGTVSLDHNIKFVPNTNWTDLNLKKPLEEKYDIFTTVINFSNIVALSEYTVEKPDVNSLLSISVHSGVGAGLILNNEIFIGQHGYSLEIGHLPLYNNDNLCSCGLKGCLETEISYPNLIKHMKNLNFNNYSIDDFIYACLQGNPQAIEIYDEYLDYLAYSFKILFLIIDPAIIKVNCQIMQSIPKSVEILKTKIHSQVIKYSVVESSTLNSYTRLLGFSILITKGYLNLNRINLYTSKENLLTSYNDK